MNLIRIKPKPGYEDKPAVYLTEAGKLTRNPSRAMLCGDFDSKKMVEGNKKYQIVKLENMQGLMEQFHAQIAKDVTKVLLNTTREEGIIILNDVIRRLRWNGVQVVARGPVRS